MRERLQIPNPVTIALDKHQATGSGIIAFIDSAGRGLTYGNLGPAASTIASRLRTLPVDSSTVVVGIVSSTGGLLDFACAYFGVLLAGYCALTVPVGSSGDIRTYSWLVEPDVIIDARPADQRKTPLDGPGCRVAPIDELRDPIPLCGTHGSPVRSIDPSAPAEILHTSGTTGERKGVVVPYENVARDLGGERWGHRTKRGSVLHALPFGSTPAQSMVLEPLRPHGHSVHVVEPDVGAFIRAARLSRPTSTILVPAMAERIAASLSAAAEELPSFGSVRVLSAPIKPSDLRLVAAVFPNAKVTNLYTSTESWPAHVALDVVAPPGNSATPTQSSTEIRIVSPAGEPLPYGTAGNVELKRPGAERVYVSGRHTDGTLRTERLTTGDGWISTGDIGRVDAQRRLTLLGRRDGVLNIGGQKVAPSIIEEAVAGAPGVGAVVAIGLPHPTLGQYVAVAVSPADADGEKIRRHLLGRLPRQFMPRKITCIERLPRTAEGVIDRTAVERMFAAHRD